MDRSSSDLEFFDFKNSSDEEIKEIQAILKSPGSNGCVELPWEISVSHNSARDLPETEGVAELDLVSNNKPTKSVESTVDSGLNYTQLHLPPTVETFVTLPTTVGPYQNAPYFVSRTIPYLRAYPPMGVPFFACPIPSGTGEGSPYGQFMPAEKSDAGQIDNKSTPNNRDDSQSNRQAEKRTDSLKPCPEPAVPLGPSSMPLVPLPPSTFAVAGYPPGLHTLPYPQMAGQATSPAMYYVPVFNHPYGGYLPSPPMMLPETTDLDECLSRVTEIDGREKQVTESPTYSHTPADCEPFKEATSNVQPECRQDDEATPPAKTTVLDSSLSSSKPLSEGLSPSYLQEAVSEGPPEPVAPSLCLRETVASNDHQPDPAVCQPLETKVDKISAGECLQKTVPSNHCPSEQVVRDPSRCWADLFKGPREVNGIDRHPPKQRSTLKKDITNGKVYSMPVNH